MPSRWLPAVIALLLLPCAVSAQSPTPSGTDDDEQPLNEVFQTELVYPQGRGEIQITVGPRSFADSEDVANVELSVEYGITDKWEVFTDWDAFSRVRLDGGGNASGPSDVEFGTQYSFMHIRGSNTHAALGVGVTAPTGDISRGLTEGLVEFNPYVLAAHDFPRLHRTQLFGSLGFNLVHRARTAPPSGDDEESDTVPVADAHDFLLNVGCFVPVRKLRYTLEWNWATNQWNNGGADSEIYATPGIVWVPAQHWEFGVGVPFGVSHDATRRTLAFNIIYEFDTRHDEK